MWVCAWGLCSVPLSHRPDSVPGPPCLNAAALQGCVESGTVLPHALFLVLRIALAILCQEWFQVNFRNSGSSFVKNVTGNLLVIALSL